MNNKDLYWIAGILEGEGCFGFRGTPTIALNMTDYDVMKKAHSLLTPNTRLGYHKDTNYKTAYIFTVCGKNAAGWMMTLYSLMGERRKEKIKGALLSWRKTRLPDEDRVTCLHNHRLDGFNNAGKRYCRTCASKSSGKSRAKRKLAQRNLVVS